MPPTPSRSADPSVALRAALYAYFDALYAAGMDPANKTDDLEALLDPSCACRSAVNVLRTQAERGRHVDYRYTLRDVTVVDVDGRGGVIRYTVSQSAGALRDAAGRVIERYPKSSERFSAHFVVTNDAWLLKRVESYK